MKKIQGTYCATLTPFNEDFSINKKLLLEHCNNILKNKVDGIGIFGSTGESNSLSIQQKIETIQYLIENNFESNNLIPGTGLNSINDTVYFTKAVAKMKVKAVLVLPPFYYKNIQSEGLIDYYSKLIEEVNDPNLHYLLYHFPKMAGVSIDFNVIEKLLLKYPNNIVGIKDSSGDEENMIKMIKVFSNFAVFSGSDSLAYKIMRNGGAGAITAASNISGELLAYIVNNFDNASSISKFNDIVNLQEEIRSFVFSHEPISTLKAFISLRDKFSI